jgi:hypothetical protein
MESKDRYGGGIFPQERSFDFASARREEGGGKTKARTLR